MRTSLSLSLANMSGVYGKKSFGKIWMWKCQSFGVIFSEFFFSEKNLNAMRLSPMKKNPKYLIAG